MTDLSVHVSSLQGKALVSTCDQPSLLDKVELQLARHDPLLERPRDGDYVVTEGSDHPIPQ